MRASFHSSCMVAMQPDFQSVAKLRSRGAVRPVRGRRQLNLLAQPPLEADAVAVANDQHPDQELRIDRRSTDVAIERCQLLAQVSQHLHYNRIDPAQEMARRNAPFEVEQIEQLALIARLPTHHGKPPPLNVSSDGITVRRKSRALFQQYRPKPVIGRTEI